VLEVVQPVMKVRDLINAAQNGKVKKVEKYLERRQVDLNDLDELGSFFDCFMPATQTTTQLALTITE